MVTTNLVLGAVAGLTIFLGLPVARWRGATDRLRGLLALASAGVLLFLVVEVGYHAMESVEASAKGGAFGTAVWQGLILVAGFVAGLVGLAWLEEVRARKRAEGLDALEVATMIAVGIGLHNFAEGLAIGQSFAGGAASLGTVLVVGFALHNATEGFGIAGPLVGRDVGWGRLLWLGLVAGGPTAVGAALGGVWVNRNVELLFLSLATGSLVYVTRELLRLRFASLGAVGAMAALAVGFFVGFGTELVVGVAESRGGVPAGEPVAASSVRFDGMQVSPPAVVVARGVTLTIENAGPDPLVFEGNGLFVGETVAPASAKTTVTVTGADGQYRLVDERGQSAVAAVTVRSDGAADPLAEVAAACGALTVLEGHVRVSKELHDRGLAGVGPSPALDLTRAGRHAGHPQHELLEGDEPDARALQRLLRDKGVFDILDDAMTAYVTVAGDSAVPLPEVDQRFAAALAAVEDARRAIAGEAYASPAFRARVARFVMETAASEYATASEGGQIVVDEPGVPGKDAYIEYQDARGFLLAARSLLGPETDALPPDARQALDELLTDVFAPLDPRDPNRPVPSADVEALVERVGLGLAGDAHAAASHVMK